MGELTTFDYVASVSAVASWDITKCRFFLVDYDGGSDNNIGYVDATPGAVLNPTGIASKTISRAISQIPLDGRGRTAALLIKARGIPGTGDSLTRSGVSVTLDCAAASFPSTCVGTDVLILGATNAGNNGLFPITARNSATSITFENGSGVTETSSFTYSVSSGAVYKKADGVTDDSIDLRPLAHYNVLVVRGSTDLTNSLADKRIAGARIHPSGFTMGPNADGSWTCGSGSVDFDVNVPLGNFQYGSYDDINGAIGLRLRFKGNVTAALTDVCKAVAGNGTSNSTVLKAMTKISPAPASGDCLFLEQPGAAVSWLKLPLSRTVNEVEVWGLRLLVRTGDGACSTGNVEIANVGFTTLCRYAATTPDNSVFDDGSIGKATTRLGLVASLFDEAGTSIVVGAGMRSFNQQWYGAINVAVTGSSFFCQGSYGWYFYSTAACTVSSAHLGMGGSIWGGTSNSYGSYGQVTIGSTSATYAPVTISGQPLSIRSGINWLRVNKLYAFDFGGSSSLIVFNGPITINAKIDGLSGTSTKYVIEESSNSINGIVQFGSVTPNTATGPSGDAFLGGVKYTFAELDRCGVVDAKFGQTWIGNTTNLARVRRVTNGAGGQLLSGTVVRLSADDAVVAAQADSSADATAVIGILANSPAAAAAGVVALTGEAVAVFDGAISRGVAYLSPGTAGNATSTVPASGGTNQKLRLGMTMKSLGSGYGVISLQPTLLPIAADDNP